jgi:hypothetical protein
MGWTTSSSPSRPRPRARSRCGRRPSAGVPPLSQRHDEEIDELILSRLRQRRAQQAGDRTASAADLVTFFNEPEPRIQNRLRALADQGLIKESAAAPDRWMIVLASDPSDDD